MPTSEADLDKLRDQTYQLRQQLAEAKGARETVQNESTNDLYAAQLKAEVARLEADVAAEKAAVHRASASTVLAQPMADAEAAMASAAAQQDALKAQAAADKENARALKAGEKLDPNYIAQEAADRASEAASGVTVPGPASSEVVEVPDKSTAKAAATPKEK